MSRARRVFASPRNGDFTNKQTVFIVEAEMPENSKYLTAWQTISERDFPHSPPLDGCAGACSQSDYLRGSSLSGKVRTCLATHLGRQRCCLGLGRVTITQRVR